MSEYTVEDIAADRKARLVLSALHHLGGEGTTSDVRQFIRENHGETLSNDVVRYRFKNAEKAGLVTVTSAETSQFAIPPKVAAITPTGEDEISRGLLGEFSPESDADQMLEIEQGSWEDMRRSIEKLETRIDSLTSDGESASQPAPQIDTAEVESLREDVESLEARVEQTEDEVQIIRNTLEDKLFPWVRGMFAALDADSDVDIEEYVEIGHEGRD